MPKGSCASVFDQCMSAAPRGTQVSTPQIFLVAAVLLGFSIGPSADTVGSVAESHSVESKEEHQRDAD